MNYSKLLRKIRNSPKLWADDSAKIERLLLLVKTKAIAQEQANETREVGPYSGLTRNELRQSGTCETDWF